MVIIWSNVEKLRHMLWSKAIKAFVGVTVSLVFIFSSGCFDDGINDAILSENHDSSENTMSGSSSSNKPGVNDTLPPVPGGSGQIRGATFDNDLMSVQWYTATDDGADASELSYSIYISEYDDIGTVDDIEENGTMVTPWTAGLGDIEIKISLDEGKTYYCNILVTDGNGNYAAYNSIPVTVEDMTAPEPGRNGNLAITDIGQDCLRLLWGNGSDNVTADESIQYRVYVSLEGNIDELENFFENGEPLNEWTTGVSELLATELVPGKTYYFNVALRDAGGNLAVYKLISVFLPDESIYMFATGTTSGNIGGREGADALCLDASSYYYENLSCAFVRAFVSVSAADQIKDFPSLYGIPAERPIRGPGGGLISPGWGGLLSGSIDMSLDDAGLFSPFYGDDGDIPGWWSGSTADGGYNDTLANCNGWTETKKVRASAGSADKTNDLWIDFNEINCSAKRHVVCLCWD